VPTIESETIAIPAEIVRETDRAVLLCDGSRQA
jgi:hypothetical protein